MLFLLQPQEKVFSLVRGRVFSRAALAEGPMIDGFGMENLPEKDMSLFDNEKRFLCCSC
jgi:hypothetical protein